MKFTIKITFLIIAILALPSYCYNAKKHNDTYITPGAWGHDSDVLKTLKKTRVKYERLLVIVIPSYNNKEWYAVNLASVFAQKYTNYHVIYTDDASTDGTGDLVENYIKEKKMEEKVTLIRNKENQGPLANRYYPIHSCPDHAVIVNLDGDDWFLRDDVLATINSAYENPNVWLTYGQFINWPSNKLGYGRPVPQTVVQNRSFKKQNTWILGQPRTFYAWLFKQIKEEDLMHDGKFFRASTDVAMMMPLMEMVGDKFLFIPDVVYQRNVATDLNTFKVAKKQQRGNWNIIMNKPKYAQIKSLPFDPLKDALPTIKPGNI